MYDLVSSMHLERRLYNYTFEIFLTRVEDNRRFKGLTYDEKKIMYDFLMRYCDYNSECDGINSYLYIIRTVCEEYKDDLLTQGSFRSVINELFYICDDELEYTRVFDILCRYFGYSVNYKNMNNNNVLEDLFTKKNINQEYMTKIINILLDRGAVMNKIELVQKYDKINNTSFESYVYRPDIKDPGYD